MADVPGAGSTESATPPTGEARIALGRSAVYGLLAGALRYPEAGYRPAIFRRAVLVAEELRGPEYPAEFREAADRVEAVARSLRRSSKELLTGQYIDLFGHSSGGGCPPYEIEYGPDSEVVPPNRLADVTGFYRGFGLGVRCDAGERGDHFSVETEFMRLLAVKEAHALVHHGPEQVEVCRSAQRTFLQEHVGRWVPIFAHKVVKEAEGTYYGELATLAGRFVQIDCARLGAKPEEDLIRPYRPPTEGDLCMSCEIAGKCAGGPPK